MGKIWIFFCYQDVQSWMLASLEKISAPPPKTGSFLKQIHKRYPLSSRMGQESVWTSQWIYVVAFCYTMDLSTSTPVVRKRQCLSK
jgi:hypothetical protein